MNRIKKAMALLMLTLLSYGASGLLLYMVSDALYPPVTGDGHRYMPIGNAIRSAVLAVPVAVAAIIRLKKYLK